MQQYSHASSEPLPIAPLVTFRILFGGLMMVGAVRFMLSGWVERLYVEPRFFFKFYGFEWVAPLGQAGMYALYGLIALSAAMVMLGLFYRLAAVVFFLAFTYSELIDLTNYLNHYYLVCLLALLMTFLPAHRRFSLDVWRRPALAVTHVPAWVIHILMLQVGLVYFFAGFAKLNPDWLLRAMPLAVWLPAKAHWPLLGPLFEQSWAAYAFSWGGALYDLTIPFWLLWRPSRPFAYAAVLVFHLLTKLLFNIGLFPFIMIFNTLIFFPPAFHERWLGRIGYRAGEERVVYQFPKTGIRALRPALALYFVFQLLFPLRYLLYPGNVLWTEQGYRFAWRVMLLEKAGQATFFVHDPETGHKAEVDNSQYLTSYQEKQMAIQPDMILQYAHFLEGEYRRAYRLDSVKVTVDCFVALNGRASRRLIDPDADLTQLIDGFRHKSWILPYEGKGAGLSGLTTANDTQ
ncbi:MAG: HTTM domain-containing protein [Phaeodactylibacter sp.]|nr:HTTM domain-containing protein [Phaeodactylibacter sp.]